MSHSAPSSFSPRLWITIALAGSVPAAEGSEYLGAGFVEPTLGGIAADAVEVMDLDGDGLLDLIALESDGTLSANLDFVSTGFTLRRDGFDAMAVTRTGGERLWAVSGGRVVEVRASDLAGITNPLPTQIVLPGLVSFAAQDRPGGARLVCVDTDGGRAAAYAHTGAWQLAIERFPTPAQSEFHDAALLDWAGLGSDWFAVISDLGVHGYDESGFEGMTLGGDPTGAFLDVIPGAATPWGHDLLVYHFRQSTKDPHLIWLANAFHGEVHFAQNAEVREVTCLDFLAAPGKELMIAAGATREVWILKQTLATTEQEPIFTFDLNDVFMIDVDAGAGAPIGAAPAAAAADVEGDGDDDLVLVDDVGRKVVLTSETFDEELLRTTVAVPDEPWVDTDPTPTLHFEASVAHPASADAYELQIWYQPDINSPLDTTPLYSGPPQTDATLTLDLPVPNDPAPVFQFMFRPVDLSGSGVAYPALIRVWSPSPAVNLTLGTMAATAYAWWDEELDEGGGGTTRNPVVGPPIGT